jgi:hypothetical protein
MFIYLKIYDDILLHLYISNNILIFWSIKYNKIEYALPQQKQKPNYINSFNLLDKQIEKMVSNQFV